MLSQSTPQGHLVSFAGTWRLHLSVRGEAFTIFLFIPYFERDYLLAYCIILHAVLLPADFNFRSHMFREKLSGVQPECQAVWIEIGLALGNGGIQVQSVACLVG